LLSAYILLIIRNMKLIPIISIIIFTLSSFSYAADNENAATPDQPEATTSQPSPPETPRTEPNLDSNRIQELIKNTPQETELLQLDTGKENEKLIGFYRSEGSGTSQGGIIIFPDQSTHIAWPEDMSVLSNGLADFGWYTLAIYIPQPPVQPIPERTLPTLSSFIPAAAAAEDTDAPNDTPPAAPDETPTSADIKENTATDTPEEPYEEAVFRLGKTAISYMTTRDDLDRFIVIGIGTGASWAAQYVKKYQEEQDLRLLMINAKQPNGSLALTEILPEIKDTIIDLHQSSPISSATNSISNAPANRLRLARHKKMDNFHQSRLPATTDNWKRNNSWLLKHVRGVINTYIVKAERIERELKLNNKAPTKENAPGQ